MIVSEPRKPRPHGAVLAWYAAHPVSAYAVPAIVFYELQQGAEITRRQDEPKAAQIDAWISRIASEATILAFDAEVARETARLLRHSTQRLFEDAAIAATARVYGLTVATRNTRHLAEFKVPLVNPFLFPLK